MTPPIIVVEGPDGSGKTSLIQSLGYTPRRLRALRGGQGGTLPDGTCGPTDAGWGGEDEAVVAYGKQILAAPEGTAFDRFIISEAVYGPLLRGAQAVTEADVQILDRLLHGRGIPHILCLPPRHETIVAVNTPGREKPAFQTPRFLNTAYETFERIRDVQDDLVLDGEAATFQVFDWTRDPDFEIPVLPTCPPRVIGSPTAKYLFVTGRPRHGVDLPAFSMRGSMGVLNQSIWDAGYEESDIAFISAVDAAGVAHDPFLGCTEHTRKMIFVGDESEKVYFEGPNHRHPTLSDRWLRENVWVDFLPTKREGTNRLPTEMTIDPFWFIDWLRDLAF